MSDGNYEKVLESIDEGLSVVGDKSKEIIYHFLEANYGLKRQDIPANLEKFHECLKTIFGFGAFILEKQIIKCAEKKFGVKLVNVYEYDFATLLGIMMQKGDVYVE